MNVGRWVEWVGARNDRQSWRQVMLCRAATPLPDSQFA